MASQHPEKHAQQHGTHQTFETGTAEGRMNWVFYDFWPIMIWVAVFVLMCALPIILSGMMHNPFSSADVVWWGYGLLLTLMFLGALVLFILTPQFVGMYTLLVSIYYLILAEQGKAFTFAGGMPWGNSISILFLTYVLIGNIIFMQAGRSKKKSRL